MAGAEDTWDGLDPDGPPRVVWAIDPGPSPVCVLLGAFDPPTRAHVELIHAAARSKAGSGALCMTRVVLDRPSDELLVPRRRLAVVERLARSEGLGLLLANRGTYLEVARAAGSPLVFVVGSDKLAQLADPVYYDDPDGVRATFEEVSFLVVPRPGWPVARHDVEVMEGGLGDDDLARLSASEVRRRLRAGASVAGLVPPVVAEALGGYTAPDRDG